MKNLDGKETLTSLRACFLVWRLPRYSNYPSLVIDNRFEVSYFYFVLVLRVVFLYIFFIH